ncbi:MAG: c-type cytochrome biogenesis protein CcsB [Cyanobacteria bacterium]|nr:c-type cytochrome biogenesis protein CcsB [Cyanobacteriota bacterium]
MMMLMGLSETQWVHTAMIALIIALFSFLVRSWTFRNDRFQWIPVLGVTAIAISMVALIISLFLRSLAAEYFALSNMYESMLVLIIGVQLGFLLLDRWFKLPHLGWPVALLLIVALTFDVSLPTEIKPLQAALQSYWRSIHVPIIILSYAMFTLAFLSSIISLFKLYFAPGNASSTVQQPIPAVEGPNTERVSMIQLSQGLSSGLPASLSGQAAGELSEASLYDELTYRCVAFGFPLLAIGIILGGLWANEAWGNYWSWDPKESMSLVTLLGYGVYLHLRVNGEHSPKILAWVSVAGYALMLITYFGVNLMGLGLHSYGKIG